MFFNFSSCPFLYNENQKESDGGTLNFSFLWYVEFTGQTNLGLDQRLKMKNQLLTGCLAFNFSVGIITPRGSQESQRFTSIA